MKPILICVAGGSASGKTTVVEEIKRIVKDDAIFIKHDDYYKNQDHLSPEDRKKTNYDHPDALENDLLVSDLEKLLNKELAGYTDYKQRVKYRLIPFIW